jgi:hypothetical protein
MEYYDPPVEPVQKDRTLINVLLAGCGCLFLIAVIAGIFFGRFFSFTNRPKKTVQNQIDAINENSFMLAYSYFSNDYQKKKTMSDFRERLREFAPMLPIKEVRLRFTNGPPQGIYWPYSLPKIYPFPASI